jgi:hypothetical protein
MANCGLLSARKPQVFAYQTSRLLLFPVIKECLGYLTPDASFLAASGSHHLSCSRPRIRLTTYDNLCASQRAKQKLARCQVTNDSHENIVELES